MIIDASVPPVGLNQIPAIARAADEMGFGALWTMETMHDPFLPGALIAEHTSRIQFGTGIAIAFSRSPANLAYTAWDLQESSGGRFILGLGTQVKAHIERRYGMPWPGSPVKKLREQIKAVRSIWHTWQTGEQLRFQGEYYRLSLMTPFFNPGPIEHPDIPIFIAGVNTGLAKLAGELCDGFVAHPFHSARYLREVVLPAIQAGREKADRSSHPFQVSVTAFAASNEGQRDFIRQQIAFYASTPSYRAVMNLHGWTETAEKLSGLAARGQWGEMPSQITDEMLSVFAVLSNEADLPGALLERYDGLADRLGMYMPFIPAENDTFWRSLISSAS
jgi:probable F420-dependent oxidoreductase